MKLPKFIYNIFKPFINFFKEINDNSSGKKILILWVIIAFFAVIVLSKTFFENFANNNTLGVDISNISSNDHIFFAVKKKSLDYDDVQIGQYIMFHTTKMEPHVSRNVAIIKKVVAKEGDHIQIKGLDFLVNGKKMASLRPQALEKLKTNEAEMQKEFIVSKNSVIVLGSYERSYDSRYWGELTFKEGEKVNNAKPILF
jgi:conjugal transfer pilin signal peptidase TrbI